LPLALSSDDLPLALSSDDLPLALSSDDLPLADNSSPAGVWINCVWINSVRAGLGGGMVGGHHACL